MKENRILDIRLFEHLYESHGRRGDSCVYCGVLADTMDHVPPISWCQSFDKKVLETHNFFKVPCCNECNNFLNNMPLFSVRERLKEVRKRIKKKYKKVLSMPKWDEEELQELSKEFADHIRQQSIKSELTKERITHFPDSKMFNLTWEPSDG